MQTNGQSQKIASMFADQTAHLDTQLSGVENSIDRIGDEFHKHNESQIEYQKAIIREHEELKEILKLNNKAQARNNLALRVMTRVFNNSFDRVYRLIVLLILLLAGVKTAEILVPLVK